MSFHRANGSGGSGIGAKLDDFFEKKELPMYKDKPYNYASPRRKGSIMQYRQVIGVCIAFALLLLYLLGVFSPGKTSSQASGGSKGSWNLFSSSTAPPDWDARRNAVKEAFALSWDGYEKYAWGQDEYHPNSKDGRQMIEKGLGWIIVDALDTLMIMNMTTRLSHAREWITTSLDYNQDHDVNTFETTIRMLGGLLSAHYLSTEYPNMAPIPDDDRGAPGEDLYLEKAADLADRLLGAFDSHSGIPFASINLKTSEGIPSHADAGASSTAEAASVQLEFKYLAYLTGEKNYWEKAEKVIKIIDDQGVEDGLVPIFVYASTGGFRGDNIRLGSRGDSYYEYLIKQYLQTSGEEPIYQEMWNQTLAGVHKHLITYSKPSNFTILGERPQGLDGAISPKMDHLVCFMPGTIALGATGGLTVEEAKRAGRWGPSEEKELDLAKELTKTCWGMYKVMATGLAPEIAHFQIYEPPHMESDGLLGSPDMTKGPRPEWRQDYIIKANDNHNLQRPETVESLFYMWRITGDPIYREWGWEMFKSFVKYTAADDSAGFTSLAHANEIPPIMKDNMESFWLAETLKYFYLLFSPNDFLPLDSIVINTEAHIFPRFKLARGLKTGWTRKPRDAQGKLVDSPNSPQSKTESGEASTHGADDKKAEPTLVAQSAATPTTESNVTKHDLNITYSTVDDIFLQDSEFTNASTFDFKTTNFGLRERSYPNDDLSDPTHEKTQWQRFAAYLAHLNRNSPMHTAYKLLFLGRHGDGFHNAAEAYYGTPAWNCYWSIRDGNDTVTWSDAELTPLGISQALGVHDFWHMQINEARTPPPQAYYVSPLTRAMQTANHTFFSLSLPEMYPFRPTIKELLREGISGHTCDRRSTLSSIRERFPNYKIENNNAAFSEEDALFQPLHAETHGDQLIRSKRALDEIFWFDRNKKYISVTSHSGEIASILEVLGHRPFPLMTGAVIPVLVKAVTRRVFPSSNSSFEQQQHEGQGGTPTAMPGLKVLTDLGVEGGSVPLPVTAEIPEGGSAAAKRKMKGKRAELPGPVIQTESLEPFAPICTCSEPPLLPDSTATASAACETVTAAGKLPVYPSVAFED